MRTSGCYRIVAGIVRCIRTRTFPSGAALLWACLDAAGGSLGAANVNPSDADRAAPDLERVDDLRAIVVDGLTAQATGGAIHLPVHRFKSLSVLRAHWGKSTGAPGGINSCLGTWAGSVSK